MTGLATAMLIASGSDDHEDEPRFKHQPSDVLFEWVREAGYWNDGEAVAHHWTFGDADIEQEASMLDYAIESQMDRATPPGWYVMEGFSVDYSRDYYGEVSGYPECDRVRPAGFKDFVRAGIIPWRDGAFWADDSKRFTTGAQGLGALQRVALAALLWTRRAYNRAVRRVHL